MAKSFIDFFPLIPGLSLEYQGRAPGGSPSTSRFEVLGIEPHSQADRIVAKCRSHWASGSETGCRDFVITRREDGVFTERGLELPLPPAVGRTWQEGNLTCSVASVDAAVRVPAGQFERCLRVDYSIEGGEQGSGQRYYASGIGLVREDCGQSASPWSRVLTAYKAPCHVFIVHAIEDKDEIALPLAAALRARGLRVCLDEFLLQLGESLDDMIDRGLSKSFFGIVILSPHFFKGRRSASELGVLASKESNGRKAVLPVWHRITQVELLRHAPILADRPAANSEKGLSAVVDDILEAMS